MFYDRGTNAIAHDLRPDRPGWFQTGWAIFLGYVWAAVLLIPLGIGVWALGVMDIGRNSGARQPHGFVRAPYLPGGVWAVAADLAVGGLIVALTALTIHDSALQRTGFELPRGIVFATLAVTGWVPYLGFHALALSGGAGFLSTLVVLRWTARPSERSESARWPWRPLLALLAVAAVLVFGYGSFHPLLSAGYGTFADNKGKTGAVLVIRNGGFADLTIVGADLPASVGTSPGTLRPLAGSTIEARKSLTLVVKQGACLSSVMHIRYRLLGHAFSEPVALPRNCGLGPSSPS